MRNNLFTKLAFLTLVLCLILSVGLVSCGKDDADKPDDAQTGHQNNVELLSPDKALSLDGYAILRADKTKQEIKDAVVDLHEAVQATCGLELKKTTDFSGGQDKEIIIGDTKRMSASGLKVDQYQIIRRGDRIAILGGSNEAVVNGVKYFIENLLCDKGLLLTDGYDYTNETKYSVTGLKFGDKDINEVYVRNDINVDTYAESIISTISDRIGISAKSSKNDEKVNIIVTSDPSLGITEGNWGLIVKDNKLYVVGTTDYELRAAFNYFVETLNKTNGVL